MVDEVLQRHEAAEQRRQQQSDHDREQRLLAQITLEQHAEEPGRGERQQRPGAEHDEHVVGRAFDRFGSDFARARLLVGAEVQHLAQEAQRAAEEGAVDQRDDRDRQDRQRQHREDADGGAARMRGEPREREQGEAAELAEEVDRRRGEEQGCRQPPTALRRGLRPVPERRDRRDRQRHQCPVVADHGAEVADERRRGEQQGGPAGEARIGHFADQPPECGDAGQVEDEVRQPQHPFVVTEHGGERGQPEGVVGRVVPMPRAGAVLDVDDVGGAPMRRRQSVREVVAHEDVLVEGRHRAAEPAVPGGEEVAQRGGEGDGEGECEQDAASALVASIAEVVGGVGRRLATVGHGVTMRGARGAVKRSGGGGCKSGGRN